MNARALDVGEGPGRGGARGAPPVDDGATGAMGATDEGLPWEGRPYSVARDGVSIANCESEPVRTPGCIQAHGALLALAPEDLAILQASANTAEHLGKAPSALLGRSVAAALGEPGEARLRRLLDAGELGAQPLYVMTVDAHGDGARLDASAHLAGDSLIVELEPCGRTDAAEPDYYAVVRRAVARLQGARSLADFAGCLVEEVRSLTALDRVMVYRFHPDLHGEVFAEARREDLESWLGLHYPADDIPRQVRELFTRIWLRPLSDVSSAPVEMEPLADPRTGAALDMTQCALRGASVMYTEYLANMGVSASLTMPLLRDGELWGMIACHHCTPTRFAWPLRTACEFVAQVASLQIRAVEDREQLVRRLELEGAHARLISHASAAGDLAALADGPVTLLDGMDAGGAALLHRGRWHRVGSTPSAERLDELAGWLGTLAELAPDGGVGARRAVFATDALGSRFAAAKDYAHCASGLLAVPLGRIERGLMLWFRPETELEIDWAGAPEDKPTVPGPHGPRLTPRGSFELFVESVRGTARPWRTVEIDAVRRLRTLVTELVVARVDQLSEINVELARSNDELDAFAYVASHDLKEPLRGISKYAHQLLVATAEDDLDNRRRLEALMRLTSRMDGLLDSLLHFSRVGRATLELHEEDLAEIVEEALEITCARRSESAVEIVLERPLPTVRCDRIRVREIYANLVSNAMKYNDAPVARIELVWLDPDEQDAPTRARSGGATVFAVRDNGIGIDERHFGQLFEMFRRLHARDAYGGGTGTGMAIVKRLVERHEGVVWIDSEPGRGTTVSFTLAGRADS